MECGNSEVLKISIANVAVLSYDFDSKLWSETNPITPLSSSLSSPAINNGLIPSVIYLLSDPIYSSARIVARRQTPQQEVLLNCLIGPGLQYKRPTSRFFEWRDSGTSNIFGFNFYNEVDADQFITNMQDVISKVGRSRKVEPQSTQYGSLENIKNNKFETLLPPGNLLYGLQNMNSILKSIPKSNQKRDSLERTISHQPLVLNPEVQGRPLPPVPADDTQSFQANLKCPSLTRQNKKAPLPPMYGKNNVGKIVICSSNRPKTLHPVVLPSQTSNEDGELFSRFPEGYWDVPPPPPLPPGLSPSNSKSITNNPVIKKRSRSVGLLDGISSMQLKKFESSSNGTSLKESNYVDMMSEIADRIKRRKEQENNSYDKPSSSFFVRPNSAKCAKVPQPAQVPGKPLKKDIQHVESFTSGILPSLAENNHGQGYDLLIKKLEELKMNIENMQAEFNNQLVKFKDDVISAMKQELSRR